MATTGRGTSASVGSPVEAGQPRPSPAGAAGAAAPTGALQGVAKRLFEEAHAFDFFQAVRVLARIDPARKPVGREFSPRTEIVRFRAHQSLSFPPSSIFELQPASEPLPVPAMIVNFMGLTGPSGVLPRHYTELLLRLEREAKGPEKHALRGWFDLFNHRLISLFVRAWEKYRFYIGYERREYEGLEPDPFTRCLFSLVGLGMPPLRNRLRVFVLEEVDGLQRERALARIDDLALLHYSGFLAHQPRCAVALEALLGDYFQLPIQVRQFQGQWLLLDAANQSRMGGDSNNQMGVNLVAGERVWDVQSKVRIRVGPLRYAQFTEFLPDRSPVAQRKTFFLLAQLVRLYVGPELDFDVQLVLRAVDVPACQLAHGPGGGPQLGWNTWITSAPPPQDVDDPVFEGEEVYRLNGKTVSPPASGERSPRSPEASG